jgi:hypothetical protein
MPEMVTPTAAAARAATRATYCGRTAAEIVAAMDDDELARNARKGGTAAIEEMQRRQAVRK